MHAGAGFELLTKDDVFAVERFLEQLSHAYHGLIENGMSFRYRLYC